MTFKNVWVILLVWIAAVFGYIYIYCYGSPGLLDYRLFEEDRQIKSHLEEFEYQSIEALRASGWKFDQQPNWNASISKGQLAVSSSEEWNPIWHRWDVEDVYNWKITTMAKFLDEHSYNVYD